MKFTLILGGARSGKSALGETLARQTQKPVTYIATSVPGDEEMRARIAHHRQRRPAAWLSVEEPVSLGDCILTHSSPERVLIVDCLTLWLTNLLFTEHSSLPEVGVIELPPLFQRERASLLNSLEKISGELIVISNEIGLGVVPCGSLSRCFVDEAGRLNQAVAARADKVVLVAAGLPLVLKDNQ